MNIDFVEEPENELVNRKNLYINPDSELSITLSRVQDSLDSDGFPLDRSNYKYVKGKLCKFQIELISSPDLALLTKRTNSLKKLNININKMKWDFNESGGSYFMKIGKIQDKDLHIVVASFHAVPTVDDHEKIKDIRDKAIRNEVSEDEDAITIGDTEEETKDDDGEILLPMKSLIEINSLSEISAPTTPSPRTEISSVRVGSSHVSASQNTKLVRPSPVEVKPPVRVTPLQPIRQSTSESSGSSVSMKDIQVQHNRSIGRSGTNTSTVRPVVTVQQYTQNSAPSVVRSIPVRQPVLQSRPPLHTARPPQTVVQHRPPQTVVQHRPVETVAPAAVMPKPNIVLYQQRQLQALVGGNKPVTSFKIRG